MFLVKKTRCYRFAVQRNAEGEKKKQQKKQFHAVEHEPPAHPKRGKAEDEDENEDDG